MIADPGSERHKPHPIFREKDIFLPLLTSVAQFYQFIHLPGWLDFHTMHTSLHFTPSVTYFCCLVTQLQLGTYLSHKSCLFPGKLIIYLEGFLLLRMAYFASSKGSVHTFAMGSMSVLLLQTLIFVLLEVKAGTYTEISR